MISWGKFDNEEGGGIQIEFERRETCRVGASGGENRVEIERFEVGFAVVIVGDETMAKDYIDARDRFAGKKIESLNLELG